MWSTSMVVQLDVEDRACGPCGEDFTGLLATIARDVS
jgi:hypothetical protein